MPDTHVPGTAGGTICATAPTPTLQDTAEADRPCDPTLFRLASRLEALQFGSDNMDNAVDGLMSTIRAIAGIHADNMRMLGVAREDAGSLRTQLSRLGAEMEYARVRYDELSGQHAKLLITAGNDADRVRILTTERDKLATALAFAEGERNDWQDIARKRDTEIAELKQDLAKVTEDRNALQAKLARPGNGKAPAKLPGLGIRKAAAKAA